MIEIFEAVARDRDAAGNYDPWVVMFRGSPRSARTKIVVEAGQMLRSGYTVLGLNRQGITVTHADGRLTEFRVRRAK